MSSWFSCFHISVLWYYSLHITTSPLVNHQILLSNRHGKNKPTDLSFMIIRAAHLKTFRFLTVPNVKGGGGGFLYRIPSPHAEYLATSHELHEWKWFGLERVKKGWRQRKWLLLDQTQILNWLWNKRIGVTLLYFYSKHSHPNHGSNIKIQRVFWNPSPPTHPRPAPDFLQSHSNKENYAGP